MNTATEIPGHIASISLDDLLADAETELRKCEMYSLSEAVGLARSRIGMRDEPALKHITGPLIHPSITPTIAKATGRMLRIGLLTTNFLEREDMGAEQANTPVDEALSKEVQALAKEVCNIVGQSERIEAAQTVQRVLAAAAGH